MAYELLETCFLVPGFTRFECASWLQAVGSVGAIFASAFIAIGVHRQEVHQRKLEDEAEYTRFLGVVCQLIRAAQQAAITIYTRELETNVKPGEYASWRGRLNFLGDALGKIPVERFELYEHIEAWMICRGHVGDLLATIDAFTSSGFIKLADAHYLRNAAHTAIEPLHARAKLLQEIVEARGGRVQASTPSTPTATTG